jgi:hypothetical protein
MNASNDKSLNKAPRFKFEGGQIAKQRPLKRFRGRHS